ncbi:hypothetical protein DDB_G0279627 [Dictyostelium discoideum AX4]|uniref:Uncharacterized protein n=1 Tax=Dictyostelium discoideum TaxID=44689 RepID=Q54WJ1_DICDI|nr:hypothetical protein DDB_G0279627 [Dictyostelium discoideum AX4]EAL67588.1 hypothetical protein DDB_G0279627 [Dictyostelium discoideum AX4]|eukprot:XP_641562.1 hypothetical protein DDB_G0279627 [Dictyostelium discoideum AX4]
MTTNTITTSSMVLFRRLIREGTRYNTFKYDPWWRTNVIQLFRDNKDVTDPNEIRSLQDKVKSYRYLIKSSKDLSELLDSYNIGLSSRQRVEKSSNRVGLTVPEWPEDRDRRIQKEIEESMQIGKKIDTDQFKKI